MNGGALQMIGDVVAVAVASSVIELVALPLSDAPRVVQLVSSVSPRSPPVLS